MSDYKCECDQSVGFTCLECNIDSLFKREESLRQQLTAAQEELKEAREVIGFYGDIDSWHSLLTESIKYHRIDLDDVGDGEFDNGHETDDSGVGGKRARAFLAKYPREITSAQDAR